MNFSPQGQGLAEIETSGLPRRLRPIHPLSEQHHLSSQDHRLSFYNAVWCAARDRQHPGGNLRPQALGALDEVINESVALAPKFPLPIVEFFQQWITPDSELNACSIHTVARIAVDTFYVEKAAFETDPASYRERLRRGPTNSTSAPGEPAH